MSSKIGRNEPCPCGSGKKYKKCHGLSGQIKEDLFKDFQSNGLVIKDFTGPEESTLSIGSPGVKVWGMSMTNGDFTSLEKNPENYIQVINVDIPALLPLKEEESIPLTFENQRFFLHHRVKKRGQEFYSTLDSSKLPYFSSLQFQGELSPNFLNKKALESRAQSNHKSYDLIVETLHKMNSLLSDESKLHLGDELLFSYHILYYPRENFPHNPPIAKTTFPYTGLVDIKSPDPSKTIDDNLIKEVLSQKLLINDFSESQVVPKTKDKEFEEKTFILTHDFSFYCSQHPEALQELEEEHLRDLYLILAKAVFINAEGEPFHYDGKLDFKITNSLNKYEFVTGEFKWWSKEESFKDAFHQAVRKHATGQEACIYILMLSRNKNISNVYDKIISLAQNEPEYLRMDSTNIVPDKSKQLFTKMIVRHRGKEIPLIIGMIDCYFTKQ